MKSCCLLFLTFMLAMQSLFAQNGLWRIENARLPDGKPYNGTLAITHLGSSYTVDWKTTAGNYRGVGLMAGDRLFVGYGLNGACGIVVYKANPASGRLEGSWTAAGLNGATGTETLSGKDGSYEVIGTNPDGNAYRGTLTLQKTGDTFQAQWQVANQLYNGVGFWSGDYFIIGYGPEQAFGTVEYRLTDSKAEGRWTMGGSSQFGIENITR